MNNLKTKIANKKAHIGIIGLGYVGLPLALLFCELFGVLCCRFIGSGDLRLMPAE